MSRPILTSFPTAVDPFQEQPADHAGLDFAYGAGRVRDDATVVDVAAGTVTLTDDATNYVEVTGAGAVSANTAGFTAGRLPLYTVVVASGVIGAVTDRRSFLAVGGGGGALPLTTKGDLLVHNGTDLVRLPAGADGHVVTADAAEAAGVKWAAAGGGGAVGGKATKSSTQAISAGTNTTISWDGAAFDSGGVVDTAGDRFVAPATGYYLLTVNLYWNSSHPSEYHIMYRVNGGTDSNALWRGTTVLASSVSAGLSLTAADTVQVRVMSASGGTLRDFTAASLLKVG